MTFDPYIAYKHHVEKYKENMLLIPRNERTQNMQSYCYKADEKTVVQLLGLIYEMRAAIQVMHLCQQGNGDQGYKIDPSIIEKLIEESYEVVK